MIIKKKVEELKEGIVLAKDIVNDDGLLLVTKGTVLDDKLLSLLKARGIKWVYVDISGINQTLSPELEEEYKKIVERIDTKFKEFSEHPVMMRISNAAKEYWKTKLSYQ